MTSSVNTRPERGRWPWVSGPGPARRSGGFPSLFQHFASPCNTRYDLAFYPPEGSEGPAGTAKTGRAERSFRSRMRFCNIKPKYVNMADINNSAKDSGGRPVLSPDGGADGAGAPASGAAA